MGATNLILHGCSHSPIGPIVEATLISYQLGQPQWRVLTLAKFLGRFKDPC